MNGFLFLRKDVIQPLRLHSHMIELGDLVCLVLTSYVCQVRFTYRPLWQDELLTCQLYRSLDGSLSILYGFPAAVCCLN